MDNFSKTIGRTTPPDWRLEKIGRQTRKTGTRKESRQSISFWELHISHALLFSSISMFSRLPITPQTHGAARCRTSESAIHARGKHESPQAQLQFFRRLRYSFGKAFQWLSQWQSNTGGAVTEVSDNSEFLLLSCKQAWENIATRSARMKTTFPKNRTDNTVRSLLHTEIPEIAH